MKKTSFFSKIINWLNHFFKSIKNFVKSSILSLTVIIIILLLLTKMDQTLTLMVDLVEGHPFSLFLSFLFINALAIALSHYPIYTYYAANLNKSGDYTVWEKIFPFRNKFLKGYPLFIFTTKKDSNYTPDNLAHYFRYSLGILIYFVWLHYINSSFMPKIYFEGIEYLKLYESLACAIPFVLYILLKEKITRYNRYKKELLIKKKEYKLTIFKDLNDENEAKLNLLYRKFGIWYSVIAFINILLIVLTLLWGTFSKTGFLLLILTSYAFMFNYVFFRLLRTKLEAITDALKNSKLYITKGFVKLISILKSSKNYLLLFHINFLFACLLILYSTIATITGKELGNGIPILLAFFYFYYFIIANLKKFFFVIRRMKLFNNKKYKQLYSALTLLIILLIITNLFGGEVKTHELDTVNKIKTEISEKDFTDLIFQKNDSVLFFIASHGGGLKANVWTLNVLNTLQERTGGKLLNQTIALSGASGGSLGLALYTGLYKEEGNSFEKIQSKIKAISEDNYVSPDLTLTLGLDTYRKLWPLNKFKKDRPYFSMIKYQNHIDNSNRNYLDSTPFRDYWKEAFLKEGYFPSLIMNTSSTKGRRGILWSVKQDSFNGIFHFSDNLSDLKINRKEKTLPFYQAVSTTNRFPFLSPAAKIPGYGHYIDAGAIDNSGLLSCLDLYYYLLNEGKLQGKKVVFIEILNSKNLYIDHVLSKIITADSDPLIIDENETDNIIADLQTALNLDKIPGYLEDFFRKKAIRDNKNLDFIQLYMPHKISMNDVEKHLGGELDKKQYK
ncbi:MAG: patatin-like phospholipase family protein [Arcobacter sp.]|nr:patatin-like phospholipase family protein [Arcobacter sp.]